MLTVYFMKNKYSDRLITYNEMNLDRTVEQYEYTFKATRNLLLSLYSVNPISYLHSELQNNPQVDINQLNVHTIYQQLAHTVRNNPHLMLEDVYLVINQDLVISKDGISSASLLFTKYVTPLAYMGDQYWLQPFEPTAKQIQIYPTKLSKKDTFAVVIKNPYVSQFYMLAFIDQAESYERFGHAINSNFWIQDIHEQLLGGTTTAVLPSQILQQEDYSLLNDNYYFTQRGSFSNLLYVDEVPKGAIDQEISQLYWLLVPFMLGALAISVFFSIFYSLRISNPLKHILHSMQSFQARKPAPSSIKEFHSINQYVLDLNDKSRKVSRELKHTTSLLKHYAFIDKLKAINSSLPSSLDTEFSDKPFIFMVVDVYFKKSDELLLDEGRAVTYLCEYIRHSLSESSLETLTFQTERTQISSILFAESSNKKQQFQQHVDDLLRTITEIFSWDEDTCIFTIGTSNLHTDSSELTEAYEAACDRVNQRELNEHIQVITADHIQEELLLSSSKEQELQGYLTAGHQNDCQQWIENILRSFTNKQARLKQVRQLLGTVIQKTLQMHYSLDLDKRETEIAMQQIQYCYTYEDCQKLLNSVTHHVTSQIKARNDEKDDLIQYVTQYLENYYHEDIFLELVADRMHITTSYLSTYFKGKTGVNFKDYLTNLRMAKAKELLLETDLKIQDIAMRVGYQNRNPFIRMFRKHTGVSPRDYRKQSLE